MTATNICQDIRHCSRYLKPKLTEYKIRGDKTSKQKFSLLVQSKESHECTKKKIRRYGVFKTSKDVRLRHLVETYRRSEEMRFIHIQGHEA